MLKVIILSIWIVSMAIADSSYPDEELQAVLCHKFGFSYFTLCHECDYYESTTRSVCRGCCEAKKAPMEPYPKGQLEICQCKFAKYPNIVAFIKSHERRSRHPNLSILYSNITEPRLHLFNKNGQKKESGNLAALWEAHPDRIDSGLSFLIAH